VRYKLTTIQCLLREEIVISYALPIVVTITSQYVHTLMT